MRPGALIFTPPLMLGVTAPFPDHLSGRKRACLLLFLGGLDGYSWARITTWNGNANPKLSEPGPDHPYRRSNGHDWPFSVRHLRRYQGGHVPCAAQALRPLIRMAGERSDRMEGQEAPRFAVGLLIRVSRSPAPREPSSGTLETVRALGGF